MAALSPDGQNPRRRRRRRRLSPGNDGGRDKVHRFVPYENADFEFEVEGGEHEGAHEGAGLGHEFLRHVERAGILVHLVEPAPMDATDPLANYQAIHQELVQYNEMLASRPQLVVVSKAELPGAEEVQQQLQEVVDSPVLLISAVTGEGLNVLSGRIVQLLDQLAGAPVERTGK